MVNFGPWDTVPKEFAQRNLYKHNPTVTLMRTSKEENIAIGKRLAEKWNQAAADMEVLLPLKGVSMIDAAGQPFDGPEERAALYETLKKGITNPHVKIVEMDNNINDKDFAITAAKKLLALMK